MTTDRKHTELAERYGVPFVELARYIPDPKLAEHFSEEYLREKRLLPLFRLGTTVTVAMVDPHDVGVLDEVARRTGWQVEPVVCTPTDFENSLNRIFAQVRWLEGDETVDVQARKDEVEEVPEMDIKKLEEIAEEAPVIRLVNELITRAVRDGASDIHLEPTRGQLVVRLRVDGILRRVASPPRDLRWAVVSRVKIMSQINIAEKRVPQDGRCGLSVDGREIDLRVNTFPTIYGEKVVMRILDVKKSTLTMEDLGFSKAANASFKRMISKPYGIVLVTGPTGSGKSTTLYAALRAINSVERNIVTIEDPVEYRLDGISQAQINPRAGFTFANGLRSIVRQDPDVIMVGEIRDSETASIAIHAALTGHLVFSTLHTNDAPGAVARLVDMGVEPFLVASALEGVIAQRLVRTICPRCKETYRVPDAVASEFGLARGISLWRGRGCDACRLSGYAGRMGLFQIMTLTDRLREQVMSRASSTDIARLALEEGMGTLWQDGVEKTKAGVTTVEEVARATKIEG